MANIIIICPDEDLLTAVILSRGINVSGIAVNISPWSYFTSGGTSSTHPIAGTWWFPIERNDVKIGQFNTRKLYQLTQGCEAAILLTRPDLEIPERIHSVSPSVATALFLGFFTARLPYQNIVVGVYNETTHINELSGFNLLSLGSYFRAADTRPLISSEVQERLKEWALQVALSLEVTNKNKIEPPGINFDSSDLVIEFLPIKTPILALQFGTLIKCLRRLYNIALITLGLIEVPSVSALDATIDYDANIPEEYRLTLAQIAIGSLWTSLRSASAKALLLLASTLEAHTNAPEAQNAKTVGDIPSTLRSDPETLETPIQITEPHYEKRLTLLSGDQVKILHHSLISAFPSQANMQFFIRTELNENLDDIAGNGSLSEIVFNLIEWAQAQGRLKELVKRACDANAGNKELKSCAASLFGILWTGAGAQSFSSVNSGEIAQIVPEGMVNKMQLLNIADTYISRVEDKEIQNALKLRRDQIIHDFLELEVFPKIHSLPSDHMEDEL